MKSVVAFFLACLMLVGSFVPQNDLAELSKLPQLLEHYRFHHSAAGGGLSLAEFLAEHYGAGTKEHFGCTFSTQHQHDHQGLPLHGRHAGSGGFFMLLATAALPASQQTPRLCRLYRPAESALYQDGPEAALLQPPRA